MAVQGQHAKVTAPVETKVVASSWTNIIAGLITWMLVTYTPSWKAGIPPTLQPFIPMAAAWLVSTWAAYRAPHTHRPDLELLLPPLPANGATQPLPLPGPTSS